MGKLRPYGEKKKEPLHVFLMAVALAAAAFAGAALGFVIDSFAVEEAGTAVPADEPEAG